MAFASFGLPGFGSHRFGYSFLLDGMYDRVRLPNHRLGLHNIGSGTDKDMGAVMARAVSLKEVTADNWEAVVDLELAPEQTAMVANNCYSLAESKFDPDARPRAIYAGKRIVGFLMYEVVDDERPFLMASIYRFMIDRRQQGKGHGRAAFAELLKEIQSIPGVKIISICYMASNYQAKQFYANFGFREVGRDCDGETIAELNIFARKTFERNL